MVLLNCVTDFMKDLEEDRVLNAFGVVQHDRESIAPNLPYTHTHCYDGIVNFCIYDSYARSKVEYGTSVVRREIYQ